MLKKLGIALIILGLLVGAFVVVWWQVIAPRLVKLPSDIDISMDFKGDLTLFVNKETGIPVDEGNETTVPVAATREFSALAELFTSDTGFFADTMKLTMDDKTAEPQVAHYALSRTTRKCVQSDENWAFSEDNKIDRTGSYGPLFPSGLKVGDKVSVYYDDPAKAFEVEVVEEIEDWNGLGITALKIDAQRPSPPYDPESAEVLLVRGQSLPTQISLEQIKAILKFDFDIPSVQSITQYLPDNIGLPGGVKVPVPSGIQIPQAVKDAIARLEQTIDDHPLTVSFNQESSDFYYIEQVTGATVDATFDRTTTMTIDTSIAEAVTELLGEYTSLPLVGSKLSDALARVNEVADAYSGPIKVFNLNITMTEDSTASMVQEAKDKISLLKWVQYWIPVIAGAVAGFILLLGITGLTAGVLRGRRKAAT